jgi:hypothetical protein
MNRSLWQCASLGYLLLLAPAAAVPQTLGSTPVTTSATPAPTITLGTTDACNRKLFRITSVLSCPKAPLSRAEPQLVQDAFDDLNLVLASNEFKQAVLATHFDPAQTLRDCDEPECKKQMSPQDIYDLLTARSPIKVNVTLYNDSNPFSGNQGFEDDKNAPGIAFGNRDAIHNERGFLASLMLHETMHILGFRHYVQKTNCGSVPYLMNQVYVEVAMKLKRSVTERADPCAKS